MAAAAEDKGARIDLSALNIEQLAFLGKSMNDEIEQLTSNFGTLKLVLSRYNSSMETLDALTPENKGWFLTLFAS